MDRIINVKVGGNYLSKDNKNAGVRGEANVTKLRITFDEGWDGYAIKVIFWNARGLNPVSILLEPHLEESRLVYLVPIPYEPMEETGKLTFVIEGSIDDKVQRSLSDTLEVKESPIAKNAGQPVPPTPDELTQVRGEIEAIKGDIEAVGTARDEACVYSNDAKAYADNAYIYQEEAKTHSETASANAVNAVEASLKAQEALSKKPIIRDGYWWIWNAYNESYEATEVKAQAGSTVYIGDNPSSDDDVWIDPDGDTVNLEELCGRIAELEAIVNRMLIKTVTITLLASEWAEDNGRYAQTISIPNTTPYSKVDLQPSAEQLSIFHEKDIAFVTENENGVVTVFCIGQKPTNDYVMQATITEVAEDE